MVTVHVIVGDLRNITVLWCSHHARAQVSLHRRDQKHKAAWAGFGTNVINCWLPLLRVREELGQGWVSKLEKKPKTLRRGNQDCCDDENVNVKMDIDKPLSLSLSLPPRPNIGSPGRASKRASHLVLFYDLFHVNLRQSDWAVSAFVFRWGGCFLSLERKRVQTD